MAFTKNIKSKKKILIIIIITVIFVFSIFYSFLNKNKTKILLIVLDGASWNVIHPLILEQKLPNIRYLMENGSWGGLIIFLPFYSEVIATTIITGRLPKEHGIIDRLIKDPKTGEWVPITSNIRKTKALWNILSEYRKNVCVVGYLNTWPPEKVKGVILSDRFDNNYLSEDSAQPAYKELCSELEFRNFFEIKNSIFSRIEKDKFPDFCWWEETKDQFLANFANYLIKKKDFDFFTLYLRGIDVLSHIFWKYMFPSGFNISDKDVERYKTIIKDYYIYCDTVIGDLLNKIDKNTIVIIVSDHGFRTQPPGHFCFSGLNRILEIIGLNKIQKNSKIVEI